MFMLALFVLSLSVAQSNGLIVFQGDTIDLTAILLTAVSVLVTVLGVFIAILALWGYKEIRDRAVASAVKDAVEAAKIEVVPVAYRATQDFLRSRSGIGDGSSDEEVNEIAQAVEPEEGPGE